MVTPPMKKVLLRWTGIHTDVLVIIDSLEAHGVVIDKLMEMQFIRISKAIIKSRIDCSAEGPDVPNPAGPITANEPDFNVKPPELYYGDACEHCHNKHGSIFRFLPRKKCSHCGRKIQ